MTRTRWLVLAGSVLACEPTTGSSYPTEDDDDSVAARLEQLEARRRVQADAPATADATTPTADGKAEPAKNGPDGKPLPKVRDRDPEEEKRKLAQSRAQSAQARKLLEGGRLSDAVSSSRAALKVHEQNVDAMLVLAEVFLRQSKFELTLAVTQSALAVDEKIRNPVETSQTYNLQGFAWLGLGNPNAATNAFKKAAETDDKNAAAWNNLGTRYLAAGDVVTASSCFAYALELEPNMLKAHLNQGAALREQGKWKDAEQAFLHALQYKRDYPEAHFNLGVLYLDADPFPGLDTVGRLNKAIAELERYKGTVRTNTSVPRPRTKSGVTTSEPVSVERADDYIRVAQKGLDREQRRLERETKRASDGSAAGSGAAAPGAQPGDAATPTKPPAPGGATTPKPQAPGGATQAVSPQTPGGAASPQAPAKPQTPGTANAANPQTPGGAAAPQAPAKPQTPGTANAANPQTPGGVATPQAPTKPQSATNPQTPGGAATPQAPAKPTDAVNPQTPGGAGSPQAPAKPQTPGTNAANPQTPGGVITVKPQTPGGASPVKPQSPGGASPVKPQSP